MKLFCSILVSVGALFPMVVFSQQITGTIRDMQDGPIPGAYITNHRAHTHAHTNAMGQFRLTGNQIGDTLEISHIGFERQSLVVRNLDQALTINLEVAEISLSQVQITTEMDVMDEILFVELETNPVNSSQEILRRVPGLFIAQHAGGGKAEQIFLRGFDVDHGTDVSISVDDMPVNMVSHAHGQGYADLHFVIPETVERIEFGKGPYTAQEGNFNTAGFVKYKTKERLEKNVFDFRYGMFNTYRALGMMEFLEGSDNQSLLVAGEYMGSDGPFESPQNFTRLNAFGKYCLRLNDSHKLSISASWFDSEWDASGQIPERAVDSGLITRWGSIDDTEGGTTSRGNLIASHQWFIDPSRYWSTSLYRTYYDFDLYSNFTFFLNDSINGDQIRQRESRWMTGGKTAYHQSFELGGSELLFSAGAGFRSDEIDDVQLSRTRQRDTFLGFIARGDVSEQNLFAFTDVEWKKGHWMVNPSIRWDQLQLAYVNRLQDNEVSDIAASTFSPKLNITYSPTHHVQFFVKSGIGFHSNDSRVVLGVLDPGDFDNQLVLPRAFSGDFGMLWKIGPRVIFNTAIWALELEQEFVYVGDEGIVEPSGRTVRKGIDAGIRVELLSWLIFDSDFTIMEGRSTEGEEGENFIPLAPDFTLTSGLTVFDKNGFSGNLNMRHLRDRPANEDNSVVAHGYTVFDGAINYHWRKLSVGVMIQNLMNTEWNEAQFDTTSLLPGEILPVSEIHYTPGNPLTLSGRIGISF